MSTDKQVGFRMVDEDHPPIPAGHSRISVQIGEALHRLQIETAEIEDCAEEFEDAFSQPLRSYRHTPAGDIAVHEIVRQAAKLGFTVTVGQGALWLMLYSSDRRGLQAVRDEMWKMVAQDGGVHVELVPKNWTDGLALDLISNPRERIRRR
jgi:hypothetical protein